MTSFIKQQLTQIFCRQMQKIIKKHKPTIVAVAGSVGKTTTKLAIATVLSETLRVQYQKGNYNAPISIPLIFTGREMPSLYNPFSWFFAWLYGQRVLHSKYPYDVVVVELGTDAPGDIPHFESLLHPKITVITAVAEEHMEFFRTLDAVAAEELSVANFSDIVVINSDDIAEDYLEVHIPKTKEIHSYGFGHAEYKITITRNDRPRVSINMGGGNNVSANVDFIAKHTLKSLAAAVAVADLLELKPQDIQKAISKITPLSGRMQLLDGIKDSTIIDDTYNSSPLAAKAALDSLYEYDAPQRIAILGMMNELGATSKEAHTQIGNYCDSSKLDLVVTIGQDANEFLAPAAANKGCKVIKCDGPIQAGKTVAENLKPGAVILAKGSQNGVFAEEAVKQLLSNPEDASKLVRQNAFWLKKKHTARLS